MGDINFSRVILESEFGGKFKNDSKSSYFSFGLGDGFADFLRHELGEFGKSFADEGSNSIEKLGPGFGGGELPGFECGFCSVNGGGDFAPSGFGSGADEFAVVGGGVLGFANALVAGAADKDAIDQEFLMHGS